MADIRIKNMTYSTITLVLTDERMLTLGPRETKPLEKEDFWAEEVQKALRSEDVMVFTND